LLSFRRNIGAIFVVRCAAKHDRLEQKQGCEQAKSNKRKQGQNIKQEGSTGNQPQAHSTRNYLFQQLEDIVFAELSNDSESREPNHAVENKVGPKFAQEASNFPQLVIHHHFRSNPSIALEKCSCTLTRGEEPASGSALY
jgi:hypothetical protein